MKLRNPWAVFIGVLVILAAVALYQSEIASQHHRLMEAFVMMVIAMIFVKRIQTKP